ncbi:malonyl-CoA decarboxylase, mitochondrial-like isoform X2 [Gigantopelta aegis]|nr:malonyl-CoA decarboxylase, mitochondrial-like isoform X2 [Gigantopelta aegis]
MQILSQQRMSTSADNIDNFLSVTFGSPDLAAHLSETKCKTFCDFFKRLSLDEKNVFLKTMAQRYGINQDSVLQNARSVIQCQDRGDACLLKSEERLKLSLVPRYQQLFTQIGRLDGGVKFLVDMRADILASMTAMSSEVDLSYFQALNYSLKELMVIWFSVGLLQLQRITWESSCDLVQKISDYEAVHPIRSWSDVKQRVGSYRRCFVFTHNAMPREPVVVLHTALTSEISSSIHSIIQSQGLRRQSVSQAQRSPEAPMSDNLVEEKEDPSKISAAVFYSITSTLKGLSGVDMGNYLIKCVVRELQSEHPQINQFSSLSPIPGFRDWLIGEVNKHLHLTGIGELTDDHLLTDEECGQLHPYRQTDSQSVLETFKFYIQTHQWITNPDLTHILKVPLMRLCARYLYMEKRRGYALNPVATFHLRNGAVIWRLNWMADTSMRGLSQSCAVMVNYRYFLENTEKNSRNYLENHIIEGSKEFIDLATGISPSPT